MKRAKHSAPSKPERVDVSARFTLEAARGEGRCLCEGCRACRGLPGYPCASIVVGEAFRCRFCSG